jgi:hypothetical protein
MHATQPNLHSGVALGLATAFLAMFALCSSAPATFYVNCAGCHTVPQNGMAIVNFETTTNLGQRLFKVFKVSPGQTAIIQLNVTNRYGGSYAMSMNNLDAGSVNNSSDYLAYNADPTWSSYFPGTSTNFFMAGPTGTSPDLWTFNLVVKTNTPADFYMIKTQMAGYDSASRMWSQQESFYVQVVAAVPPVPTLRAPQRSRSSFSVQVATNSGFTYYLEYKTDLTATSWNATAQTPGDGKSKTLTDTTANDLRRFYQVRVQ